jgi:hypothetical protein
MTSTKQAARLAGLTYLLCSIPGFFGLLYVPSVLVVHGDPVATAHNIAASEGLYRAGILANVIGGSCFIFVAFALYRLMRGVDQLLAALMAILIVVSIPVALLNELNHVAVLTLARPTGPVAALGQAQTDGLVAIYLAQYHNGVLIAEVFWGLWLFPMAILVFKSGFLPRFLGVLLVAAGFGYLIESCAGLLTPTLPSALSSVTSILRLGELPMIFWLLIMGAKDQPLTPSTARG